MFYRDARELAELLDSANIKVQYVGRFNDVIISIGNYTRKDVWIL